MQKHILHEKAELLVEQNQLLEACKIYQQICELDPCDVDAWLLLGRIHAQLGNYAASESSSRQAVALSSDSAEAQLQLANVLRAQAKTDAAVDCYKLALQINPGLADAHQGLGLLYRMRGDLGRAVEHLDRALQIAPDNRNSYEELVSVYFAQRKMGRAESITRGALMLMPDYTIAHNNLGLILHAQGKIQEAMDSFREAARIDPDYVAPIRNLATISWLTGQSADALEYCLRLVQLEPGNLQNRQNMVQALHSTMPDVANVVLTNQIEQCFGVVGLDLYEIVKPVTRILKNMPEFVELISIARRDVSTEIDAAIVDDHFTPVFNNNLFKLLLTYTLSTDLEFEILLGALRKGFLRLSVSGNCLTDCAEKQLSFVSALACQFFTNEYVCVHDLDEESMVGVLAERLQAFLEDGDFNSPGFELGLAVLCMYKPLYVHEWIRQLLDSNKDYHPAALKVLLKRQWYDHFEELTIKNGIDAVTEIDDANSLSVRKQYEESPYPRWVSVGFYQPRNHEDILQEKFAHYKRKYINDTPVRVLNAGCGTGRHAIMSATRYINSDMLAVDLSLSSLAYAQRNAGELNIENITFKQADILKLDCLDNKFHIIESCGVLHHIEKTDIALKLLVDLLNPGGVMSIGLYSEIARSNVIACRNYISSKGFGKTVDDIRKARQHIISLDKSRIERRVLQSPDFYSLSTCRDLLFHVHEHSYRLPAIAELLQKCGLEFLGFDIKDTKVTNNYKALFPDDPGMTSFNNWDKFEKQYPRTFAQMYTMWCQKADIN